MSVGKVFHFSMVRFDRLAVAAGRNSCYFFKGLGKIAGGGKTTGMADDRKRVICGCQQLFSFFYAGMHEIVDGRNPILISKGMYQIIFVYMRKFCQMLQGEIIPAVLINIAPNGIAEVGCSFVAGLRIVEKLVWRPKER